MSDNERRINFSTMGVDESGQLVEVSARTLKVERILECPFAIMVPEHYRNDESCKCDDAAEREMMIRDWEYTAEDFVRAGVVPTAGVADQDLKHDDADAPVILCVACESGDGSTHTLDDSCEADGASKTAAAMAPTHATATLLFEAQDAAHALGCECYRPSLAHCREIVREWLARS